MTSSTLQERVQATLKSEDTEGTFELYVTRTPGYLWALLFKKLHIHPIAVTLLSIVIGALAGYFFWWDDLYMNLIGMFLLIAAVVTGLVSVFTGHKANWILLLVCLILALNGIQMIFLSLLGQYMSKDYMESKKRPIYIIKKKGGF